MSIFMSILRWQNSLLLLLVLTSCSSQSIYYVTPTPNTPCPGNPCRTLSQYVADQDFMNLPVNTAMEFLSGNHTLEQIIAVKKLVQLIFHGDPSVLPNISSRIVCTWPAGFIFTGITELYISALAFTSCGHGGNAAVSVVSVQQLNISNCSFLNNSCTDSHVHVHGRSQGGDALYIHNSSVVLEFNKFQHNCAEVNGGAVCMDTCNSTITGNTFIFNNADESGGALYVESGILNLTRNTFQNNSAESGGGILYIKASSSITTENTFKYNTAYGNGGTLYVEFSTLDLIRNTFQYNSAPGSDSVGGALYMDTSKSIITENTFEYNFAYQWGGALHVEFSSLFLIRNIFQCNSAYFGGVLSIDKGTLNLVGNTFQSNSATEFGGALFVESSTLNFTERNTIENNIADCGGGIAAVDSQLELAGISTFQSNRAIYGGGLYVHNTSVSGNMAFTYCSATEGGGGVYASQSAFNFTEESIIKSNVAVDGGGLLLSGESKLHLHPNAHIQFINNSAKSFGGAIKVEESNPLTYCIRYNGFTCFFQIIAPNNEQCSVECDYINDLNVSITFNKNSAVDAGADLHGGDVNYCVYFDSQCYECPPSGDVFDDITKSENTLDISSDPLYICTCKGSLMDCTDFYHHPEPVHPGGTLEVPVVACGQRYGTTPAVIQIISTINSNTILEKNEIIQNTNNKCTTLTYTIYSYEESTTQEITLYAKGPCLPTTDIFSNTLRVLIDISHCPPGFQISKIHPKCVCAEKLQKFTKTCLVDNKTVLRAHDSRFWVGYDSISQGLILHPHCPFDYCTSKEMYLAVDDSDKQCNYNRSGLLCGRCSDNLSLALGSSHCLQCSNSYLSLLAVFACAGIALAVFLLVLRLTVAAGTINGLIFYANVVAVNSATFFQPHTTNTLTVFIAWLNLDLGIETCLYNGMDAYIKTWLQFAFPFYVWTLVGMIIIGSYYSRRVAKVFGSNPVAVLATLFLLSYAKLLRTVIAALSYTFTEYPDNSQIAVWLYDGNIRYLSGKHIPLFIAAMLCLIFLFLPYTVLLTFSQWLQAKSELKIFSCVTNRYVKPFLDAYHAPYSNKHRYWTGLMLLFRFVLFLISAVNTLGDPNINLLAIASAATLILPTILGCSIYKTWSLGLLETSFIINLTILAVATDRLTGGNQNAVTFTSVSIAFVTFTGIIIYHCIQQIKGTRLWRSVYLRLNYMRGPLMDVDSGPEDPPDNVFVSGSAPTQTVVHICYHELREPCMATAS